MRGDVACIRLIGSEGILETVAAAHKLLVVLVNDAKSTLTFKLVRIVKDRSKSTKLTFCKN